MTIYEIRKDIHNRIKEGLTPVSRILTRFYVTPNQVSVTGMVLSVTAGALIISGRLVLGGLVFLFAGLLDLLDGALAHYQGKHYWIPRWTGSLRESSLPPSPIILRSSVNPTMRL